MLGGLGGRRSSLSGKAGIAGMAFMAYKAYQSHQNSQSTGQQGTGTTRTGHSSASSSSSGGGLGGMMQELTNKAQELMSGSSASSSTSSASSQTEPTESELRDNEQAANNISEETALLLIRAMVTAAYSDGSMSLDERQRIMTEINEDGVEAEDRAIMEREIANPRPLDELLTQVNDQETAEEFYMASRAAIDGETDANRAYLEELGRRLNLSEEQTTEINEMAA